jgi:hypothetical protein
MSVRSNSSHLRLFTALGGCAALLLAAYFGWGFGDEHARTRYAVLEGIGAAKPLKSAIADYWLLNHAWPDPDEHAAMLRARVQGGRYVAAMDPLAAGRIAIRYRAGTENPHPEIDGHTIELTPRVDGTAVRWDCRGGDMPDDFRPTVCRDTNRK